MILFRCPKCKEQLEAPESMQGETVACPRCENVAVVPGSVVGGSRGAHIDPGIAAAVRQSVGSAKPEEDVVLHDTACLDCGYNLKGLPLNGTCPECGMWVKRSVFTSTAPKHRKPRCSRLVYIILGLFVGALGIHNFAAGFVLRGLIEMFFFFGAVCAGVLVAPLGILLILGLWVVILLELAFQTKDANGVEMS